MVTRSILRILFTLILVALLLAGGAALYARTQDGPLGPFPGGPFLSGKAVGTPVTSWSFATDLPTIELQLLNPPQSRVTWILVSNGTAYIPCGLPEFRLWKKWPHQAADDGRALVRTQEKLHEVHLTRVDEPALFATLTRELERKYEIGNMTPETLWLFRLDPPRAATKASPSR